MDRVWIADALARAEEFILSGAKHIAEVRRHVDALNSDGRDPTQTMKVLKTFEDLQALNIQYRDGLRKELDRAPAAG